MTKEQRKQKKIADAEQKAIDTENAVKEVSELRQHFIDVINLAEKDFYANREEVCKKYKLSRQHVMNIIDGETSIRILAETARNMKPIRYPDGIIGNLNRKSITIELNRPFTTDQLNEVKQNIRVLLEGNDIIKLITE